MVNQIATRQRSRPGATWRRAALLLLSLFRHALLLLFAVFSLAPLLWALSTALKPRTEVFTNPSLIPHEPTLANFGYVLAETQFGRWFWNSAVISLSTTVLALIIGTLGGYALSRYRFWGHGLYGNVLLIVQMFPGVMLAIPIFLIFTQLGLIDSRLGLLITYLSFSLAFAVWMLKGYFDGIPREIEEAALIDGASPLGVLWRITLPLSGPGLTTVAVFTFLLAWNEFFFAYILLVSDTNYTLQMGLYTFIRQFFTEWHYLMTAAFLSTVPVLFFFFALQRYLTRGLIAGATKG